MKLFAISDIHWAIKPINEADTLIREADLVVISGDITHTKTRAEEADVIACLEHIRHIFSLSTATGIG